MKKKISIIWFRQDLRLSDNPALIEASKSQSTLPIYILDDCASKKFQMGQASKVWLHHSLDQLNQSLDQKLNLYQGDAEKIFSSLLQKFSIEGIFFNACFEPWLMKQEACIEKLCTQNNIPFKKFNSNYLWHPTDILKDDGSFYKVFSAYKRKSYSKPPRKPLKSLSKISAIKESKVSLTSFKLLPSDLKWHRKLENHWNIGEKEAQRKLASFLKKRLIDYKLQRDFPSQEHTSMLSPHLHFGEISPSQIWDAVYQTEKSEVHLPDTEHFLSEVIWREFSTYLLYHFKHLHTDNFVPKFNQFPWKNKSSLLLAWQKGQTGYPIIDAGMRELWQTGYMHNRVRMITASFLVKNLNIHWHQGRDWFWDCLVDADLANNSASWQWVAGCGADAAPYFRIFNPITQGEKFDKEGHYTRKFVPELQKLPSKYLFKPWEAPKNVLDAANIVLDKTYPHPIIDLKDSRNFALEAYKNL